MIAAVTNEAHGFDVVDLPDPVPGPEEVVIRVAACGVCGSDVKAHRSRRQEWSWAMNWVERSSRSDRRSTD